MRKINAPPSIIKSSIGIDSVHLQVKDINGYDLSRFCKEFRLSYQELPRKRHQRKWQIFLAGGQPVTVTYHLSSRSMKFEIGNLMNYSTIMNDQHKLVQDIVRFFSSYSIAVTRFDYAVDIKEDLSLLSLNSTAKRISRKQVRSTTYFNMQTYSLCIYDKAVQMRIFSTTLTRFEMRIKQVRGNLLEDRDSLYRLAKKVRREFEKLQVTTRPSGRPLRLDIGDPTSLLEDFVAFLQGSHIPRYKDHFKIRQAIENRDKLFVWARERRLQDIPAFNRHIKGRKAESFREMGLTNKTFKKAVEFYKGIPNFKFSI